MTRIIGDKSHSVIEKKNKNVLEETEEFFKNFDHGKINYIRNSIGKNQAFQMKPKLNQTLLSPNICSVFFAKLGSFLYYIKSLIFFKII